MSSIVDRPAAAHDRPETRPSIPLVPLGLSLSIFLAISFLLCAVADVIPWFQDFHLLKVLYPDIDWARPEMIGLGVIWAFLSGWYVALGFGSLYNYFTARAR
jgi:uncharacterized sodium:solute symporter family permease YidK